MKLKCTNYKLSSEDRLESNSILRDLLGSEVFSDVLLVCSDGRARSSRLLLAAVSPLMRRLLSEAGQSEDRVQTILLPSLSTASIHCLLAALTDGSEALSSRDADELSLLFSISRVLGVPLPTHLLQDKMSPASLARTPVTCLEEKLTLKANLSVLTMCDERRRENFTKIHQLRDLRKAEDGSETDIPNAKYLHKTENKLEAQDATEANEPEANVPKIENVPETDYVAEAEDMPETDYVAETEDMPETDYVAEAEDMPETDYVAEAEDMPETESKSQTEDAVDSDDMPESEHHFETVDHMELEGFPTEPVTVATKRKIGRPRKGLEMTLEEEEQFIATVDTGEDARAYRCTQCCATYPRKWSALMHIRSHSKARPYSCEFPGCGATFGRPQNLWRHNKTHTKEKSYSCPVCSKAFCERKDMVKHHLQNHGENADIANQNLSHRFQKDIVKRRDDKKTIIPNSANEINSSIEEKSLVTSTQSAVTAAGSPAGQPGSRSREPGPRPVLDSVEKSCPCSVCGKVLKNQRNLDLHIRQHTGNKSFACSQCESSYYTASALRNHERSKHLGEKPTFLCVYCGKSFNKKDNLESHLTLHTGEKKYGCPHCEKRFRSHSVFKNHLRFHAGEKEFVCQYCGKAFTQKSHLVRHSATHTGERSHQCTVCSKWFIERGDLRKHTRTHRSEAEWSGQFPQFQVPSSEEDKILGLSWEG